ncbi:MAG: ATP-binding protein [Planctomycetes bacterium]|nr:ATP-binding protein [Planctomycetota bacterium]
MWVERERLCQQIDTAVRRSRIAALLGPRQCGKTALARHFAAGKKAEYFDLEDPTDVRRLENPSLVLEPLEGLVVIDEIQRKPELFQLLRVLADRQPLPARFLILGSASPDLVRQGAETLAGRIEFIYMSGFDLEEVDAEHLTQLWHRGGFPLSYLAETDEDSAAWRDNFIATFLERDLRGLGIESPPAQLRRFWTRLAHLHGQIWNAAQLAVSLGVSNMTARRYLDILTGAYMVRVLQPWYENIKKRQVKSPKIFLQDSGLLHSLLEIRDHRTRLGHPKLGASWEGFALDQILRHFQVRTPYFWATHAGAELDLLVTLEGKRYGFECKYRDAPGVSRSMHTALAELHLEHLFVIYPGSKTYPLQEKITVVPLSQMESCRQVILSARGI